MTATPGSASAGLDALLAELRARGERVTRARREVLAAIASANAHVTADDIAARVQEAHPEVHRSTIYRTLEVLERIGLLDHVHLGHGRAVYHLASDPHHHLVCDVCGHVIEVPDDVFEQLASDVERRYGFSARSKHFAVVGRCAACRDVSPE